MDELLDIAHVMGKVGQRRQLGCWGEHLTRRTASTLAGVLVRCGVATKRGDSSSGSTGKTTSREKTPGWGLACAGEIPSGFDSSSQCVVSSCLGAAGQATDVGPRNWSKR